VSAIDFFLYFFFLLLVWTGHPLCFSARDSDLSSRVRPQWVAKLSLKRFTLLKLTLYNVSNNISYIFTFPIAIVYDQHSAWSSALQAKFSISVHYIFGKQPMMKMLIKLVRLSITEFECLDEEVFWDLVGINFSFPIMSIFLILSTPLSLATSL